MNGSADKYRVRTKHPKTGRYDRWRIRWELPPDPYSGERRRGTRAGFATRGEAEAALAELLGQVNDGTYVEPSRQRVGDYLTAWLEGLRVRPTTRDNYRTQVEVHIVPRLGGVALSDLTAEQVDRLYRQLEKHGKRAGKCRTAGGLRHSYATAALRAGVSPEVLAKRLGHASVVVTLSIYAHVFEQDDQAAAERVADAIFGA